MESKPGRRGDIDRNFYELQRSNRPVQSIEEEQLIDGSNADSLHVHDHTNLEGLTTDPNPHSVTLTQAVAADTGTDVTPAELEILTDGVQIADGLHLHTIPTFTTSDLTDVEVVAFPNDLDVMIFDGLVTSKFEKRPLVETDISDLGTYLDEAGHDALDADNPHSVTLTQAVTADSGTDATAAEIEELTDGSNIIETASTGHHHKGTGILKLARDNAYEKFVLDCEGDVGSHTGDSTQTVLHRTVIPGGLPGPNGGIRVFVHWEMSALPTDNCQFYVFMVEGTTATTPGMHLSTKTTKITTESSIASFWNQNDETVQRMPTRYWDRAEWAALTSDYGDVGAIDTSAEWSIVFRGALGASDTLKTIYLRSISVECLISPQDI